MEGDALRTINHGPECLLIDDQSAYDDGVSLATAEHAVAVYLDPDGYGFAAMRAGFYGGTVLSEGAAQVGLAWHKSVIVVSARGSSEWGDWRDDLASIFKRRWQPYVPKSCRLGRGFVRQANKILGKLVERLAALQEMFPNARLVVTGHSLGGALVPLLVTALEREETRRLEAGDAESAPWWLPVVAYPHESPRTGNIPWAEWYDERFTKRRVPTYSVVNVKDGEPDLVTRVPKRSWRFRHLGTRVIHASGRVLFGNEAWQKFRASNPVGSLAAWRVISRLIRSVQAHLGQELLSTLRSRFKE